MTVGRKCHTGIRQRMPDRNFITENENNAAHPDLQLRTAALFSWYVIERILEPSGRTSAY